MEGDGAILSGKFVEKVMVREEVFDLSVLDYLPHKREQTMVCGFLVDTRGGWLFVDGPMANAKSMFATMVDATGGAVNIQPCTLSLPRVMDVFAERFGSYQVLKVKVNKVRLDRSTAFTGDLLPRGWSDDRLADLTEHWRSLTILAAVGETEGKLTVTRGAAMSITDDLWQGDEKGWMGMLTTLVKASKE